MHADGAVQPAAAVTPAEEPAPLRLASKPPKPVRKLRDRILLIADEEPVESDPLKDPFGDKTADESDSKSADDSADEDDADAAFDLTSPPADESNWSEGSDTTDEAESTDESTDEAESNVAAPLPLESDAAPDATPPAETKVPPAEQQPSNAPVEPAPPADENGASPDQAGEPSPSADLFQEEGAETEPPPMTEDDYSLEEGQARPGVGCDDVNKTCQGIYQQTRSLSLAKINLDIGLKGEEGKDYPCSCPADNQAFEPRSWEEITFQWKASGLCHKPLYFEQEAVERYGHSLNPLLQPLVSVAHFFVTIPALPYKMGITPPNECIYAFGYYRPGNCAPYLLDPIPISLRGALFEAGAIAGAIVVFP